MLSEENNQCETILTPVAVWVINHDESNVFLAKYMQFGVVVSFINFTTDLASLNLTGTKSYRIRLSISIRV